MPGLLPPHRIAGHAYIDGGMWPATSVDAAEEASQVIVAAPLAGRVMGPVVRVAGTLLERELNRWRHAHPQASISMIRPNREIAETVGGRPMALFDAERAHAIHAPAFEQGARCGERILTSAA